MKFGNDIFIGDEITTLDGKTGVIIRYNKESYEYTIVNIDKQKGRIFYVPELKVARATGKYCPQILDLFDNGAEWKLSSGNLYSRNIKKDEDLPARERYRFMQGMMAFGKCIQELLRFKNDDWVKFAKLTESYRLNISVPEAPTDVTILDRLLEDNRPDKIYEAYQCYKKAIADEKWKNMNPTSSIKFKKGDIVVSKDKSHNEPDTVIVTCTYYDGNDEKFDGYSPSDGRTYIALYTDWYRLVESADEKDEVESGEDVEANADSGDYGELWAALKYISTMSIKDRFDLFGRDIRDLETLLYDFSPEEIIDTVNQHTKQIHIGDELYFKHVGNIPETLVSVLDVSDFNHDDFCVVILEPNGQISARILRYNESGITWEKTGNNNAAIKTLLTTLRKHQSERNNRKENI